MKLLTNMICFFDYIFYRSYINLYKTKYKDYAVPRSIGFVLLLPLMVLYSIVIITNTLFRLYDYGCLLYTSGVAIPEGSGLSLLHVVINVLHARLFMKLCLQKQKN